MTAAVAPGHVAYIITAPGIDDLVHANEALEKVPNSRGVELTFWVRMVDGTEQEITITCTRVDLPPELSRAYEMEAVVNGRLGKKPVGCAFQVGGSGDLGSPL